MANSLIDGGGKLNVKNYNEKVRKQRETFSRIDSTMAILEKLPDFVDSTLDFVNANSFTFSTSPLGFIFNILKSLGVDEETLKEWIVEILVYVLPTVEVGIKASLLANIKSLISCNADPRIPLRFRKKVSNSVYTNILTDIEDATNRRGIDINIDAIDPQGLLDLSPFTDPGKYYYFGCTDDNEFDSTIMKVVSKYNDGLDLDTKNVIGDGNSKIAKLTRADDFNAFLWYVIHKGNKQNPSMVSIGTADGFKTFNIEGDDTTYYITSSNSSLLGTIEVQVKEGEESNIIAGNTFYNSDNTNYVAICIESKVTPEGIVTGNTIVPISSDWVSCNWYVDKTNYYSSNLGFKQGKPRNYSKEKAMCNLAFYEQYDYKGHAILNAPHNIRFTILPKPYVLLPSLDEEDSDSDGYNDNVHVQWRPIRLLFDADGTPNQNGKFSLISETYDLQPTLTNKNTDGDYTSYDVNGIDENGIHKKYATLVVNNKTGKYELKNVSNISKILIECYPGLTVYEFNYDYIMGMKLFDPKVVCQRIFDNAANPAYDATFNLTLNKTKKKASRYPFIEGKQQVMEIVKTILEEDEDEDGITDCFYTFSNEQYDEMLRKTEEIRYRQLPYNQGYNDGETIDFTEVTKILEKFPEKGSLEDQKKVINQALTTACNILDERSKVTVPSDRNTTKIDFLTNILQQLVAAVVDAVLSPKVLMLLMVNRALMESNPDEPFTTEGLMRLLKNVIKSLVKEVRDLIMKKLLDYILQYLTPLALQLQAKILSEQFAAYMAIIKLLLSWFNKGVEVVSRLSSILSSILSRFKDSEKLGSAYEYGDITEIDLPSIIDNFTYADIYPSDIKDKEPVNNNC